MEKPVLKFKSKKDWLVGLVYAIFAIALLLIWLFPSTPAESLSYKILSTILITIVLGLFTWAVFSTYYLLTDNFLACISGPFRTRVFYSQITDVKPSYSGWSSLALAFDRVVIVCGKNILKRTYVSPKDKTLFIEELKKRINK